MNEPKSISTFTWPIDSFGRSVNLKLASASRADIAPFRFTEKSVRLFDQILDSCQFGRKDRAFSVIGPYGSGKSSFALLASSVLSGSRVPWLERSLGQLEVISPEVGEKARLLQESQEKGFFSVILQGEKAPFDLTLCKSLFEAISSGEADVGWVPPQLLDSVHLTVETLESGISATADVIDLYKQAAGHAKAGGYQGLFVVADEFGKFLERAAGQGDLPDLAAAQYLAELASSEDDPSLIFLVLLHQSFRDYASSLSQAQRLEWNKIQGRFKQVDFSEESENLYDLIAACLGRNDRDPSNKADIQRWATKVFEQVKELPPFQGQMKTAFWMEFLHSVYPFHPIALYALPRLSARLGQNERTLFTFLVSEDPLGFKRFLSDTQFSGTDLPSLTFDVVVDYFLYGAKFSSWSPDIRRSVSQLESALDRLGDRPTIEMKIIKILGGLQLLRAGPALPATKSTLISSLALHGNLEEAELESALAYLVEKKLVVHRKFSDEYHLWEGSDFDFDQSIAMARDQMKEGVDLSHSLPKEFLSRPLMAHQHGLVTGNARGFARIFKSTEDILRLDTDHLFEPRDMAGFDGVIIHTVPSTIAEIGQLNAWAEQISDDRILITVPSAPSGAMSLLEDLAALNRIKTETPEIREDPVALKELEAREDGMSSLLEVAFTSLTEPGPSGPVWWWCGKKHALKDRRSQNRLLSQVCDRIYPLAPVIRNELLNRSHLPTAVVIAVKKIIDGLLNGAGVEGLGFQGNGPEVSIFKAVLEKTGIYKKRRGTWTLTAPRRDNSFNFLSVWLAIEEYLEDSQQTSQKLSDLFALLQNRPYGLKAGVIPLLLWTVLIYHRDTVCLYYDGTYIRNWDVETFDLSTKVPEKFTVRWLTAEQVTKTIVRGLSKVLLGDQSSSRKVGVNTLLYALFDWYRNLPEFARQTAHASDEGIALRQAITTSVDPIDLLFTKIPVCLGLEPFQDPVTGILPRRLPTSRTSELVDKFADAVQSIDSAYDRLQIEMVSALADGFGCAPEVSQLKKKIQTTAPVLDYVHDHQIQAFLNRAIDASDRDDSKWLEALGATLTNQSPRYWDDQQIEEFREKIALIALTLRDSERRKFAVDRSKLVEGSVRLVIESSDGKVIDRILELQPRHSKETPTEKWILEYFRVTKENGPESEQSRVQELLARALFDNL